MAVHLDVTEPVSLWPELAICGNNSRKKLRASVPVARVMQKTQADFSVFISDKICPSELISLF